MTTKTNLDHLFLSNKSCERDGVIFDCGNGVRFKLARFGGHNESILAEKAAKKHKPHAFQIQKGTLPPDINDKIRVEVFNEVCMKGWEGLKDDQGNEIPFSLEKANELLLDMPDLFNRLYGLAADFDNYKADLGNSSSPT